MALITCPECGHTISTTAQACPSCGAVQTPGPVDPQSAAPIAPAKKAAGCGRFVLIGGVGFAVVIVILIMIGSSPQAKEKGRERDAIALCWKEYERKSLDPGTQRFIASACELMEKDFRTKHGVEP